MHRASAKELLTNDRHISDRIIIIKIVSSCYLLSGFAICRIVYGVGAKENVFKLISSVIFRKIKVIW